MYGISWTPKANYKDLNAIILCILKTGKADHFEADDSDSEFFATVIPVGTGNNLNYESLKLLHG